MEKEDKRDITLIMIGVFALGILCCHIYYLVTAEPDLKPMFEEVKKELKRCHSDLKHQTLEEFEALAHYRQHVADMKWAEFKKKDCKTQYIPAGPNPNITWAHTTCDNPFKVKH